MSVGSHIEGFVSNDRPPRRNHCGRVVLDRYLRGRLPTGMEIKANFVLGQCGRGSRRISVVMCQGSCPLLFRGKGFVVTPRRTILNVVRIGAALSHRGLEGAMSRTARGKGIIGRPVFGKVFDCSCNFKRSVEGSHYLRGSLGGDRNNMGCLYFKPGCFVVC